MTISTGWKESTATQTYEFIPGAISHDFYIEADSAFFEGMKGDQKDQYIRGVVRRHAGHNRFCVFWARSSDVKEPTYREARSGQMSIFDYLDTDAAIAAKEV